MGITYDRNPVTDYEVDKIHNPLEFPYGGSIKQGKLVSYGDSGSPYTLLEADGEGIVRDIKLIASVSDVVDWNNLVLNIYYGDEVTPSFSATWGQLVGLNKITGADAPSVIRYGIDKLAVIDHGGSQEPALRFSYPIPFTDGIKIELVDDTACLLWLYSNINYQDELPSCWNRNLKLKTHTVAEDLAAAAAGTGTITSTGTAVTGTGTAFTTELAVGKAISVDELDNVSNQPVVTAITDDTHCTIQVPFKDHVGDDTDITGKAFHVCERVKFLDIAPGTEGWLIYVTTGWAAGVANTNWIEGNPVFYVDAATTPSLEWTGTEDMYNGAFGWNLGPMVEAAGGNTYGNHYNPGNIGALAIFHGYPIHFTDGIEGYWPNEGRVAGVSTDWCSFYYERQ